MADAVSNHPALHGEADAAGRGEKRTLEQAFPEQVCEQARPRQGGLAKLYFVHVGLALPRFSRQLR